MPAGTEPEPEAPSLIVCLGDLVEDVVVAPVAALRRGTDTDAQVVRRRGGSAANVAVNVVAAGGRARFVGAVGDDPLGRQLTASLRSDGVEVAVRRGGRTGTVVVVLDAVGERSFFTDRGAATGLERLPRLALRDAAVLHVPAYSLDGAPLAATTRRAVRSMQANPRPSLVSVDASSVAVLDRIGADAIDSLAADVVFVNRDEAVWFGDRLPQADLVVVKGGGGPTVVYGPDGARTEVAPVRHEAWADTTGAGDAFAAGFLVAYVGGSTPVEAVEAAGRRADGWLRSINADDHPPR